MGAGASKKILLGITGSIAAYKTASLIRLLVKEGHEVRCIMTEAATKFLSPLTVSTLSKHKVSIDFFETDVWNNHVEMGLWADVFLIAPLTATTLSKLATGNADNMLVATYLSAKCDVIVAPAMDLDMWKHPSTQNNLAAIRNFGNKVIPVAFGELASGLIGDGRMAEPENIMQFLKDYFGHQNDLLGKNLLITAGPTYEHLDPVRFIGNHSSGKMGIAIANEAASRGGNVHLVLGPSTESDISKSIQCSRVSSAQQMYEVCKRAFDKYDIVIWAAAVADYRPANISPEKIKKSDEFITLNLEKTIDISASLGKEKSSHQFFVGFALETNDEESNAVKKIHKKNLDFIVLNSLRDTGAGFGHDTNKIKIIKKDGAIVDFALKTKKELASDIINEILK